MLEEYFAEDLGSIPFDKWIVMFKRTMPAPLAYAIAGYFRIRDWLGLRPLPRYACGRVGSNTPVAREDVPARALSRWAPFFERLADLGFQPLLFTIGNVIGARQSAWALFLDQPGSTLATLEWMRMEGANGIVELTPVEFNSYGDTDPDLMTGITAEEHLFLADLFRLDFVDAVYVSDKQKIEKVYQQHQERLQHFSAWKFTPETAIEANLRHNHRRFNSLLEKGIIRQVTPAEIERIRKLQLPA